MVNPSTLTFLSLARRGLVLAVAVLGLVGLCWGGPVSAEHTPLRLAASGSSSSDETEQLPCNKVYLRLAQEALRRADIDYECHALPWRRAQMMVRLGEMDAMITLATPERAQYSAVVEETLYQLPLRAFTSATHPRLAELAQLRDLSELRRWQAISYFGDGWAQSRLERAGIPVAWSRDLATVLNQLVAQRGDLTISAEVEAMPLIQALGLSDQLVVLPHVFDTLDFKFLMSKQSPHLDKLPAIAAAIRSMREDGTIARLSGEAQLEVEVVGPAAE
jgi:polar amino acid transport system substrate-binding protein